MSGSNNKEVITVAPNSEKYLYFKFNMSRLPVPNNILYPFDVT